MCLMTLTSLVVANPRQEASDQTIDKYEYKIVDFSEFTTKVFKSHSFDDLQKPKVITKIRKQFETLLNELGQKGWELTATVKDGSYIFKRKIRKQ